ncbi:MAG: hypothetical protein GF307_13650 [candidate division Zixibacteria bacterium]|nr:hypothetical protein [candidate division Zixibacteria bacterium]
MKIAQRMIIEFNRWRYQTSPISFYDVLQQPRRILVILPANLRYAQFYGDIVELLKHISTRTTLKFVASRFPTGLVADLTNGYEVYYPGISHQTKFDLPHRDFIQRVSHFIPKIAIDLEPSQTPYNAIIALKSGASARIGMENGLGVPFYNLQVRSDLTASIEKKYDDMFEFVYNFFNWDKSLEKLEFDVEE